MGILCVDKVNIDHVELILYDEVICNEMFTCSLEKEKFITFDDRKLMHKLSNITKTEIEKDAHIDLLIVSTVF